MPARGNINSKIALARGWTVERRRALDLQGQPIVWKGQDCYKEDWTDPNGQYQGHRSPDSVGTLEGILQLLWELGEKGRWRIERDGNYFVCRSRNIYDGEYYSALYNSRLWAENLAGDFVGAAWLSVFEKETTDA